MTFKTRRIAGAPDAIAPDGSEVRVLCGLSRGGLAVFSLQPDSVSKAVAHRTVEEIWYVLSGRGRIWRKLGRQEEIDEIDAACRSAYLPARNFNFAATVRSR
jgi:mannose-6-phosphate isomerase-like protein (cupin superfamily)